MPEHPDNAALTGDEPVLVEPLTPELETDDDALAVNHDPAAGSRGQLADGDMGTVVR